MKKLMLLPLLFFPVIVAFIFEYNLDSYTTARLENFVENGLVSALFFALVSLLKPSRFRTVLFTIFYILHALFIWLEASFFSLYEVNFNPSTIYILIETNLNETREFISTYFNKQILLFTSVLFLPLFVILPVLVKHLRFFSWFINPTRIKRIMAALLATFLILGALKFTNLLEENLSYLFIKTSVEYVQKTKENENLKLTDKVGYFKNSIRKRSENNETFVIVIGESHTRLKMSLYGYDRRTNPKLETIKDDLVIFDNVISPHTEDTKSLEEALKLRVVEDSTLVSKGSIIQMFNSVGFKTFWLSNQNPLGDQDNFLATIAKAADHSEFISIADSESRTPFDGELLKPFQRALEDDYPKKMIFLHLQGNHTDYKKRYPDQFDIFKTIDDKYQDIEDTIDAYDNATVYNDYILNEIIQKLKAQNDDAFMLYFSDHGEEVYQTQDAFGHNENEASKPMYDIPFVLWLSEGFKENRPIRYRPFREYMTDDLAHSIGHLANIKFEGYEASKSVFSIYYKVIPRIIQGDIDYNKLYE